MGCFMEFTRNSVGIGSESPSESLKNVPEGSTPKTRPHVMPLTLSPSALADTVTAAVKSVELLLFVSSRVTVDCCSAPPAAVWTLWGGACDSCRTWQNEPEKPGTHFFKCKMYSVPRLISDQYWGILTPYPEAEWGHDARGRRKPNLPRDRCENNILI